jgi:hypothetical protein
MPLASTADVPAVLQALQANQEAFGQALTSISTVHFARFILITNNPALGLPVGDNATLALFTEYDGDFTTYVKDFVAKLGPIFGALLQFVADPPPLPVTDHPDEFVAWVQAHNPQPLTFYSAYPTLSVVDILGMSGT